MPGGDLIRRSDTIMPTDRLDLLPPDSGSLIATGVVCPAPQRIRSLWACCSNRVSGRTMIAACANPARNKSCRYFRNGKIFMLETSDVDSRSRRELWRRHYLAISPAF
jgi:hypothetical protein